MDRRVAPAILLFLLLVVQAQLWFGRGSIPAVARMKEQLLEQNQLNEQAQRANDQLAAEVRDLKEGLEMVEEKARLELGMVKANEIFVQMAASPKTRSSR